MDNDLIQIEGSVSSLIYQNGENGYSVVRLSTVDGAVTAVGCMPGICAGETLELRGSWVNHPSFGQQFKAESVFRKAPETAEAMFRYLASGAIKGVGPARAKDIVEKFGDKTLEILENDPARLSEIRGISRKWSSSTEMAKMMQKEGSTTPTMAAAAPAIPFCL